ncbi:MAG: LapA family protein [Rhodanobacter sp.]
MRLLALIILLLFIAAGILVGALNAELVDYDFAFFQLRWPKGAALLGALVVGWVLGGLTAWLGVSSAARRARRTARPGVDKKPATTP